MFCERCGRQLSEGAAFCPSCGAMISAPAEQQPNSAYGAPVMNQNPGYGAPMMGQNPSYGAPPVYRQNPSPYYGYPGAYGTVPPSALPRQRSADRIARGGYIAAVILSAIALGLNSIYVIIFTFVSAPNVYSVIRLCEFLFCIVPFFVLCLLSKKLPGVVLAIPILSLATLVCFSAFIWGRIGYAVWLDVALLAGAVMLLITMLIKTRPLAMRIITAVLFGACILIIAVEFIINVSNGLFRYASGDYILGNLCDVISMICLYTAVIVFAFAAKPCAVRNR